MRLPVLPRNIGGLLGYAKELDRYLRATNITGIVGGRIQQNPNGTTLIPGATPATLAAGVAAEYVPWKPQFFTTGAAPSLVYKCTFNLGTVNQVAATNWDAEFTLPTDDTIKFVVLTIATASGQVTGVTISVDTAAPSEDTIAKDTPPVSFQVVLGAIGKTSAKMIVTTNLQFVAAEVFRESAAAPATGAEPFSRWWRWEVQ